jgi:hypothetical protein
VNTRDWLSAASALALKESSPVWDKFFSTLYPDARALIEAIPPNAAQSPATLAIYYRALYPHLPKLSLAANLATALMFQRKYPHIVEKLANNSITKLSAVHHYKLPISEGTLMGYISHLRRYKFV